MTAHGVRFWAWVHDSPVRVKLTRARPMVSAYSWCATDEGWSSEEVAWRWWPGPNGGSVRREYHSDGRDCDGRLEHFSEDVCQVRELRAIVPHDCAESLLDACERARGPRENWEALRQARESLYQLRISGEMVAQLWPNWQTESRSQRDHTAERAGY